MERCAWLRRIQRARCHQTAAAVGRRSGRHALDRAKCASPWRGSGSKRRKSVHRLAILGAPYRHRPETTPSIPSETIFGLAGLGRRSPFQNPGCKRTSTSKTVNTFAQSGLNLISAVARISRPGCKVDYVLVLEGPQGRQKSEALRTLAKNNSWFTDGLSHVASKDAALEIAGVWIVEIAEMDALTKATSSAIKAFLTRRRDRFRPPYGKHTINLPRQCVFAVTINPTAGGYLKDPTGARRFWPVACHGVIDCHGLEKVRDQLWAEAVHQFKANAPWWLETPQLEALATVEQCARFVIDPWEERIREWLGDRNDTSLSEVLEHGLGFGPDIRRSPPRSASWAS